MPEPISIRGFQQTSPERVTVLLSNGEEIKSTLNTVADLRLYRGQGLTEAALEDLRRSSALALTKAHALELLSRRPMSGKELRDKLVQKGEDAAAAEECARWLTENRLLDDESYAAAVVRHYIAKGYGPGRIRQELGRRGVPREYWDDALQQRTTDTHKLDRFIASRLHDPEDRDEVRKVTAALFRRGFGWDEIREALGRFRAQIEDEDIE